MTFLDHLNSPKFDFTENWSCSKIIKFQQSQALTSHFESFWSIVQCWKKEKFREINFIFILGLTAFDLGQTLKDQAYEKFKLTLRNMQILVALPNEHWRKELNQIQSPLFLLSPTTVEVTLHKCLLKDDPTMPHIKIKGNLDQININISDYR